MTERGGTQMFQTFAATPVTPKETWEESFESVMCHFLWSQSGNERSACDPNVHMAAYNTCLQR